MCPQRLASIFLANKEKPCLNNCSFMSSLCACHASPASIEHVFLTCVVWANIKNRLVVEKAGKLVETFQFYRSKEDNQ